MSKSRKKSKSTKTKRQHEVLVLIACVALSIVLHAFSIIDGFGEPDAARLATIAVEWHQTGQISEQTYALRTSPLYIHSLKILLDYGLPLRVIPGLMNWLNVILGSLTLIPLYLLWRKLSGPHVSAIACLFFTVTPAYWLANIYGMAHLPSFALFIASLFIFSHYLSGNHENGSLWMGAVMLLAILSITLKADVILCFGAFLGLTICMRAAKKLHIIFSILVPFVSLLIVILYSKMSIPGTPALSGSVGTWSTSFPFTIQAITDGYNRMIPVRTTGIFLFLLCVLGILYCIVRKRHLRLVAFSLMWACPLILFWGLKMGNSARHMMAAFCPLLFISALAAKDVFKRPRLLWIFIAAVLIGNYSVSSEGSSISPDANLLRLTRASRHFAHVRHTFADFFADIVDTENKVYIGSGTIPYVEWAVFARSMSFYLKREEPKIYRVLYDGNYEQNFQILNIKGPKTLGPSTDWFMFSFEPDIVIRQHPKWLKYGKNSPWVNVKDIQE